MNIAVIGTGYVGLTTGICFADMGNQVLCHDIDRRKIDLLKEGKSPIYEVKLEELLQKNLVVENLNFTTNIIEAIQNADIIFCAVPTPSDKNLRADLSIVYEIAHEFGKYINKKKLFVMKSTVPLGTNQKCYTIIQNEIKNRNLKIEFDVVSNPEFLRQGNAIEDTMNPDRIIVGANSDYAKKIMYQLYKPWIERKIPFLVTSLQAAEMIKYAANAFLCMKISFINEIADFCDQSKCDIRQVAKGIGLDKRIGESFLNAGIGYGGNCLKKDINALLAMGEDMNYSMAILHEVENVNNRHRVILIEKLQNLINDLQDKKIVICGLTFKPGTDDFRDAPSIDIVRTLVKSGAYIALYDPLGTEQFISKYFQNIDVIAGYKSLYDAVLNADAVMFITEWEEFQKLDFEKIAKFMKGNLILDGRNMFDSGMIQNAGLQYIGIGNS